MKYGLWLVFVLGALVTGCVTGSTANGSALVHPMFPYAVTYEDEQKKSVLGEDWKLENYRRMDSPAAEPVQIERKEGYDTAYEFDFDDDDKGDAKQKLPFPDLVFIHRKTNARLEVSTILLDDKLGDKELRVLLNDIVESQSGTRSLFVGFGKGATAGLTKRFASRLLDSEDASLGDQKGLVATIERADVDQLQLNPKARWRRSRLFMMHAPFDFYAAQAFVESSKPTKFHKYGVLLLVEYTNTPEDFEAQYPEFLRLLNKTHTLSDTMLLGYLSEPLSHCTGHENQAELTVTVSELGAPSVKTAHGIDLICSSNAIGAYTFAATGSTRDANAKYDFTKPLKPEWLTQAGYKEERPAAAADEAKPTGDPAPPATAQPPEGDAQPSAAPSPSSANSPESGSSSKP